MTDDMDALIAARLAVHEAAKGDVDPHGPDVAAMNAAALKDVASEMSATSVPTVEFYGYCWDVGTGQAKSSASALIVAARAKPVATGWLLDYPARRALITDGRLVQVHLANRGRVKQMPYRKKRGKRDAEIMQRMLEKTSPCFCLCEGPYRVNPSHRVTEPWLEFQYGEWVAIRNGSDWEKQVVGPAREWIAEQIARGLESRLRL